MAAFFMSRWIDTVSTSWLLYSTADFIWGKPHGNFAYVIRTIPMPDTV